MTSKRKRAAKEAIGENQPSQKRPKNGPPATNGSSKSKAPNPHLDKSPFTEHPNVDERRRELALYEKLGSEDVTERIEAADAIVSGLLGGEGVPEAVLLRHLEKRLFRGLASGRNASRLGFSLVLTEILGQLFGEKDLASSKYTGLTFRKVLVILVEKTQPGGGVTGQEERDHFFGQLFGIECFRRAGILFAERERWFSVLDLLVKLSSKKSWLRSQCGYVVVQAVPQMQKSVAESTLEKLAEEGFAKTPEGVGIWIAALDRFPDMKVPAQPWRHPLATTSLSALPAALKDSGRESTSDENGGKKPKQGTWTAQLHFVWDLILAYFVKRGTHSDGDASEQFQQFWNRVVDEGFVSKNSSESQKFSGFMIFQKMLEGGSDCRFIVPTLFSKNLMTCLMNQAAKDDRYLHRAALKALKGIEGVIEKAPSLLPTILKELLGRHGAYNFDQRTNTKTVDKLLQHTTPATVKPVLKILQLKDPPKSGLDDAKYHQALGGYLFRLATVPSENPEADTSSNSVPGLAIKALTELAYSNTSVPESTREALRTRTTSAFAKLVRRPEDFGHLCNAILSIEADVNADDELASVLSSARTRLADLLDPAKGTDQTRDPRQALALLHAVGILQFYNQDPDVVDLFEELSECYDKLESHGSGSNEGISEYLVEILLAMVARPSALMRQVSQQVFEAFSGFMSEKAVRLLYEPLAVEESDRGRRLLFSTEDEDMMDAGGSDEEELDSDVEIVDLEDAGSEVPADSDEGSDVEEESEGESADQNQEALDALDDALAKALGSHRLDKDAEADSSEESDMTDSEMMAVDEKLAEVFKQRAKVLNKKKEEKDAKDTVINFKHRVLDLLAIFVRQEAARPRPNRLVFDVLLPLVQLVRKTTTKALANKASEVITAFSKSLKKARAAGEKDHNMISNTDLGNLMAILRELHEEASMDMAHAFARAVSTASLAVASVLCGPEGMRREVFELYARTQLRWFQGEVKIQPAFFSDWLNWCQSHASTAAAVAAAAAAAKEQEKEEEQK
ncbi:DNA polymerase phi-domain-containing protein [Chaetomium strumarium]|uniref:DNA polymerase phi-domain-containing protein n=1 Tax=Chaetomium strumarium TaxID=1170767 RepID=A0AAJ0H0S4_9PEZI|nr:DNA polymerase phi-domain-containing protein [Chaetomium strumarium]